MLNALHNSITALLQRHGGFAADEVAVSFRQPDRQWTEALTLPTLNCFLYAVEEFTELRSAAMQNSVAGGRVSQRMPPRRYNLRYQVTAWSSEPADEHVLFWRALAVLARHNPLPEELLDGELRSAGLPLHTRVGSYEGAPGDTDLWSALALPPRPALTYSVVAPLDLAITLDAPLVLSTSLRFRRADEPGAPHHREALLVGGVVRSRDGQPVAGAVVALDGGAQEVTTDILGRYTLRIRRPGPTPITVRAADRASQVLTLVFDQQSAAYDIALD